ncbi:MAG: hypothetical protein HN742_20000 [Lentisphaerae bacterium]|jgi:hypothetical protein|nr:hypothetical protein [Lentisphaerota bacterium]MBT5612241.1 hypothetical protein [Lentisphaerota bacterium]MBT7059470.1 hypothetical protein [Lentisphaerota bacterium]MBT7844174.1 hypothetical protein [Lentisphaerota bacterium]
MRDHREELRYLKELQKVYSDPVKTKLRRQCHGFICAGVGVVLIVVVFCLHHIQKPSPQEITGLGILAGLLVAVGYVVAADARQIPWLTKYTAPRDDLITARIKEAEDQEATSEPSD